jgi:hypothetical protein
MLLISIAFQACSAKKQKKYKELRAEWKALTSTPYDSLTNIQKSKMLMLTKFYFENIQMKDSILALQLSKEDLVKQGFPEEYYDFLMENVQSLNNFRAWVGVQEFIDSLASVKKSVLNKVDSLNANTVWHEKN